MTIDTLLQGLDGVRQASRGWIARCPAHADRTPSLSVHEGDRGVLVKCWAGCTVQEIAASLGWSLKDLFFDSEADPREWTAAHRKRVEERRQRREQERLRGFSIDAAREAERLIQSASYINIDNWTDEQLDAALNQVAAAYAVLEKELIHG